MSPAPLLRAFTAASKRSAATFASAACAGCSAPSPAMRPTATSFSLASARAFSASSAPWQRAQQGDKSAAGTGSQEATGERRTSSVIDDLLNRTMPPAGSRRSITPARDARSNSLRNLSAQLSSPSSLRSGVPPTDVDRVWASQTPVNGRGECIDQFSRRTIDVRGKDVASAWRRLNKLFNDDNIRMELRRGERFEARSDRRVRLNSERHRRRFKVAVGKAVQLALRTKNH